MSAQLDQWVERLSSSGLPVFAKTVREVSSVTTDRASSARDLSQVVSHDAAMTARLIQIANSSLFNPQGRDVDTISAAVVLLGFDAVRDLAISLSLIDEMAKGGAHDRVGQTMARAFHAAVQANSLARKGAVTVSEEVFVAALLKDIGEMAFWSKGGDSTRSLQTALQIEDEESVAQQRELGFTLTALSQRLADKWSLGDLARQSHDPYRSEDANVSCILHGHELARSYEKFGWSSPESRALIARLAQTCEVAEADLRAEIEQNIDEAAAIAEKFGVSIEADLPVVPDAGSPPEDTTDVAVTAAQPVHDEPGRLLELQMGYLDRLAVSLEEGQGRDELMQLLVDGLHQGLAADVCYFMLLSQDRDQLVVKYAAGRMDSGTRIKKGDSALLAAALANKKPTHADTPMALPLHSKGSGLMCGIHIGGREIGVLYVDRATSFPANAINVFRQFSQQVVLILTQVK